MLAPFAPKVVDHKGRKPFPKRSGGCQARGEACGNAVLTAETVRLIRRVYRKGTFGAKKIRRVLLEEGIDINVRTISNVVEGRTWGWVK